MTKKEKCLHRKFIILPRHLIRLERLSYNIGISCTALGEVPIDYDIVKPDANSHSL